MKYRARADAHENAVVDDGVFSCFKSSLVGNGDDLVVDRSVKSLWYEACPDALNAVGACGSAREYGRIGRLNGYDVEIWIFFLEIASSAGDRAPGSDACNQNIYVPLQIVPDFRPRRFIVSCAVVLFPASSESCDSRGGRQPELGLFPCCRLWVQ